MLQIHLHSSQHPLKYTRIVEIFPKNHQMKYCWGEEMFAGVNVDIIVMTNPVPLEYFKSANWSVKCQNLLISGLICFFSSDPQPTTHHPLIITAGYRVIPRGGENTKYKMVHHASTRRVTTVRLRDHYHDVTMS